jgi:hypothetical protein
MTEVLQEYADSRGVAVRVDRAGGVLRGVKLIGMESLNGRRYRAEALAAAVGLYEGAKVNVNHPKDGPLAPRDYRDRLGVIRQVKFRPSEGLFGNLHFNPKHAIAEQLAWDAENNPRNVGFSHNVLARLTRDGEQTVVEAITHVRSVDLVADPAATQGLFEQEQAGINEAAGAIEAAAEVGRLQTELQEAQARETRLRRELRIRELLDAHGVSPATGRTAKAALGEAFYETLLAAADDRVEALIAERAEAMRAAAEAKSAAATASGRRPRSSEPMAEYRREGAPRSSAEFARSLLGGRR